MKRTMRKTVAVLLALAMLCSMMPAMALASWDGTTATAVTPVGDVYSVGTPEELAWVAQQVNTGNDFTGKTVELTADISLNDQAWTPIGNATNAFAGIFDGAGHEISGLSITSAATGYQGLFGNNSGTVKDFTIDGQISLTAGGDNIGAAVGFNSGTVSGVTNEATVTVNNSAIYAVGGIVGQNGDGGMVSQCINNGAITGTKCTGGVVGRNYDEVSSCYNTGAVTGNGGGKDSIGGVVGQNGDKNKTYTTQISDCYNTGAISNPNGRWFGGIVGMTDGTSTVSNCYNIGTIAQGYSWQWNPIIGQNEGTATNNYSLAGLNAGDTDNATKEAHIGIVKSEAEMKALAETLGSAYHADITAKPINNGYPILTWQVPEPDMKIDLADFSGGEYEISEGGEYTLGTDAAGTIIVSTKGAVKITGNGVDGTANSGLSISYTVAEADLTLENVWISAPASGKNMINYTGEGNKLTILGTNLLENSAYGNMSMIHVGANAALMLDGSGRLYMYKYCAGAGIGGDAGEVNGAITIKGSELLVKGSKTGPLIGNDTCGDAEKEAAIGNITVSGGNVTLIPKAQGAGIGGSRSSIGGDVYLTGGTLTIISDFTTGIGGGGQKVATATNNGNLYVTGGSLRAVRTDNSLKQNSDSATQTVDDSLITQNRFTAPGGSAVYKAALDTASLGGAANTFNVLVDNEPFYSGGLHKYYYSESTTSTISNFSEGTAQNGYLDTNLYFYLTGADHTIDLNGKKFVAKWNSETSTFTVAQLYTVTVPTGTGYTVTPSDGYTASVISGGEFKFTVTMDSDYTLNYVKCGSMLTPENGVYTISNITANKTVEINFSHNVPSAGGDTTGGNPTASVWDGETIDLRWFDPAETEFSISKPAELAGLAALVNGIYNDDIKYIYGTASYIVDKQATGTTGANNNATPEFHYGAYDFDGCTVELDSNINMGSGNNYMPIGGQYLMDPDDTTTRIDASFNGTFDGQGHTVTLYCDRWAEAYGNGQSIGLIGRLGCHDSDVANGINKLAKDCAVTDVAVKGSIKGNRSVGGIVGKIGKTDGGAIIENCANFAEITGTDSKGTGGICGAAWNGGSINNCYNAGAVSNARQNAGGIAGTCEISVVNCFNVGTVTSSENNDMAIATNNGGATFTNCYFLDTSTSLTSGVYPASAGGAGKVESKTSEEMKSADFLNLLGSEFASDTKNINNGYPVLSWQNPSAPTGSGSGGSTVEPPVTPSDKVTTTTASAAAKVTTGANGTVTGTANLTQSQVNTAINDAVKAAEAEGTKAGVEIKTTGDENASEVKVALPTAAVKSAAGNEKVTEFTVTTGAGSVKMDEKALSSLASQATGSTVEINIKVDTDEDTLAAIREANGLSEGDVDLDTALALNVTVLSDSKKISSFNGSLTVDVPVDSTKYSAGESYKVIVIHDDNSVEVMTGICSRVDGKLVVRTSVSRLSTFIVTEQKAISYSDVEMTSWFYDAVAYVTDKGLMNGVGDSEFGPEGTMTRAMLVTTLYRMEGSPAVTASDSFSDVAAGQWYTDAVIWASANKIVSGYGSGLFGTDDNITREQMATILMRYSVYKNYDTAKRADLSAYTDAALISTYAADAMEWANGEGYITGRTDTILAPAGTATRAEVATILMRFGQSMAK